MKRLIAALFFSLVIAAACILGGLDVQRGSTLMIEQLRQMQQISQEQGPQMAYKQMDRLEKKWEKVKQTLRLHVNTEPLHDISIQLALLRPILENGDVSLFHVESERAIQTISDLEERVHFSWETLF